MVQKFFSKAEPYCLVGGILVFLVSLMCSGLVEIVLGAAAAGAMLFVFVVMLFEDKSLSVRLLVALLFFFVWARLFKALGVEALFVAFSVIASLLSIVVLVRFSLFMTKISRHDAEDRLDD